VPKGTIALIIGIVLIFIARFIWKKDSEEASFLASVLGALLDVIMFDFEIFLYGRRTLSMLLFLVGTITSLISVLYMFGIITIT